MYKLSRLLTILAILAVIAVSCSSLASCRPVFDVDNTVNTTLFFNLSEMGYNQSNVDYINSTVLSYFKFLDTPGSALLGTGRDILNIATGAKLGTAIITYDCPSIGANGTIYSATRNYKTEASFLTGWNGPFGMFNGIMSYWNDSDGSGRIPTDVLFNLTFHEGVVFNNSDNGTGLVMGTNLTVYGNDTVFGSPVYIRGYLLLADGTPVVDKSVNVTVTNSSGAVWSRVGITDNGGLLWIPFNNYTSELYNVGVFNVSASFVGDDDFAGSVASNSFTIFGDEPVNNSTGGNGTNGSVVPVVPVVPGDGGVPVLVGDDGPVTNGDFGLLGDGGLPLTSVPLVLLVSLLATLAIFVVGFKY
ncbi:MAG: hypothetical protein LBD03_06610 [Methanobrevibacter sp.]|jgi:hypothetical protein|nr:hypothetical protein [Candidatus Methanovirga procula]